MTEQNSSPDSKPGKGIASRRVAVEVLIAIEREGAYSTLSLNAAFKRTQLSERDRAFVTALVQGVVRHRMELDEKVSEICKQPFEKMPASLKNVLRVGAYQLDYMDDIPPSAVVNTGATIARILGHEGHAKLTNGLLRNYAKKRSGSTEKGPEDKGDGKESIINTEVDSGTGTDSAVTPTPAQLSVKYSLPQWLVERWLNSYGQDEAKQLFEYAQSQPELTIRVCESAITPEGYEQILNNKDIRFRRGTLVSSCLILEKGQRAAPNKLPGYDDGLFTVQDEAAAFASLVCQPKPGDLVIDLCAAPGGKTLHMAEMMENTGRIIAVDQHESRLNLLKQSRNRLGLTNIEIMPGDARSFKNDHLADVVLLDAPCSGTGVINRRSDLRYRKQAFDIETLSELQRQLLANAGTLVKPGGVLVYSTCSIEPEENFDNIRWFMREFQNFEGADLTNFLPANIREELTSAWSGPACKTESEMTVPYMIQLLPSRHNVSGFFVCRLRKRDEPLA